LKQAMPMLGSWLHMRALMHAAAQSNCEPTVAQLMPNCMHEMPGKHCATWAQAMSHGVPPELLDVVDVVLLLLLLVVVVVPPVPVVTVVVLGCPPLPVALVLLFTLPPQPANQTTVTPSDAAMPQA
jgi:hypothetical protein